ncbi:MAG TPA: MlaE family lipid ABC transporter permease subunit [Xanthobacteraceae bacterium]|nr:MlaE family lipid ABC transporter permease subunit [Xanthobacteraceae bacterium]
MTAGTLTLLNQQTHGNHLGLAAAGAWTAEHAEALEPLLEAATRADSRVKTIAIDTTRIDRLDSFGAWLLERALRTFKSQGRAAQLVGLRDDYRGLFDKVHGGTQRLTPEPPRRNAAVRFLESVGMTMVTVGDDLILLAQMVGWLITAAKRVLLHPSTFRLTSMVKNLERVGWQAMPIILLITVLIGAILAQQGIFHFRRFGADIYVVDMVGVLVLRELGVLIVCIMVAGRSGSAYTAEIGAMKMREEIDALRTMGLDPVEVLILPRIIALIVAVPILTFFGSMAALYGGGFVSWLYGGIAPEVFLSRLREAISVESFEVGMIKAPFMAFVIGAVACVEGLEVEGSAESLGERTTNSVVKSIFLVIVLDGIFAMFFASIGM